MEFSFAFLCIIAHNCDNKVLLVVMKSGIQNRDLNRGEAAVNTSRQQQQTATCVPVESQQPQSLLREVARQRY